MVNTFLPYADFKQVAKSLDNQRLGKQRVEAFQILRANLGITQGWRNHPASVMWRGHEGKLAAYTVAMCDEWVKRGFQDNTKEQVLDLVKRFKLSPVSKPWWLGAEKFHESHQSNLKRKLPEHYAFDVAEDLPYQWPTPEGTFRTTEKKGK